MEVRRLEIDGVLLITPKRFGDERGYFSETYNKQALADAAGITAEFVQDNYSMSRKAGTIRGMHFQSPPHAQDKLVRAVTGSALDVVVDLRRGSPTYGHWVSAILSAETGVQIWVPKGLAHGVCTLQPDTGLAYKTTAYFSREHDLGIAWNDPDLNINWPVDPADVSISEKDAAHPRLSEIDAYFDYEAAADV